MILLDDEGNELILPKSEQIPSDYFKKGETLRAVVSKVDMRNANPVIISAPVELSEFSKEEINPLLSTSTRTSDFQPSFCKICLK